MKTIELSNALNTIEKHIKRERENCARYCELNPADAERRKYNSELIIATAYSIYAQLHDVAREEKQ